MSDPGRWLLVCLGAAALVQIAHWIGRALRPSPLRRDTGRSVGWESLMHGRRFFRLNHPLHADSPQGWPIRIELTLEGEELRLRLQIGPVPGIPERLSLSPSRVGYSGPSKAAHFIHTAHADLDRAAVIQGEVAPALALFDAMPSPEALAQAVREHGLTVRDQIVELIVPSRAGGAGDREAIRHAVALAEGLVLNPQELPSRVARCAATNPNRWQRLACLAWLAERAQTLLAAPEVRDGIERAACHEDPATRVEAAALLGAEGLETLRRVVADPKVPVPVGLRALGLLDPALSPSELVACVLPRFAGTAWEPARSPAAPVKTGPERSVPPPAGALRSLLGSGDPVAAMAAVSVFRRADCPDLEPAVIGVLWRDEEALLTAAIQALAERGSGAAVATLERVSSRLRASAELRLLAREAALRLRDRHPDVEGRVTLAELPAEAGAVTLAELPAEAGAVTLADPPAEAGAATPAEPPAEAGAATPARAPEEGGAAAAAEGS